MSPHSIPVSPSMLAHSVLHLLGRQAVTGPRHSEHDEEITGQSKPWWHGCRLRQRFKGLLLMWWRAHTCSGRMQSCVSAELAPQLLAGKQLPKDHLKVRAMMPRHNLCRGASWRVIKGRLTVLRDHCLQFVKQCAFILLSLCK